MNSSDDRIGATAETTRRHSKGAAPAAPELPIPGTGNPLDLALDGGECRYWPEAVPAPRARDWFRRLHAELDWRQHHIELFGRRVPQPRLSAWYGDPGTASCYSGLRLEPADWTPGLAAIREWLEGFTGLRFNSVLANLYRDGADSMGWHSDNERELGPRPVIASLSLGAARRFVLRRRDDHRQKHELVLADGSLLIMAGDTQVNWQHALPKARRVGEPRINLTFRWIG